jgi:hypothetical protein
MTSSGCRQPGGSGRWPFALAMAECEPLDLLPRRELRRTGKRRCSQAFVAEVARLLGTNLAALDNAGQLYRFAGRRFDERIARYLPLGDRTGDKTRRIARRSRRLRRSAVS